MVVQQINGYPIPTVKILQSNLIPLDLFGASKPTVPTSHSDWVNDGLAFRLLWNCSRICSAFEIWWAQKNKSHSKMAAGILRRRIGRLLFFIFLLTPLHPHWNAFAHHLISRVWMCVLFFIRNLPTATKHSSALHLFEWGKLHVLPSIWLNFIPLLVICMTLHSSMASW